MSLFGNPSIEPTNWSSLAYEPLLKPARNFWRTIIPMVNQLALSWPVTPTAHRHTQTDGTKWGGRLNVGEGVTEKVLVDDRFSIFFFFFGWIWLANFPAKESRHWSWQPGSYHQLVKRGGGVRRVEPQWRNTTQCKQKQANAIMYDISYFRDRPLEGRIKELSCFHRMLHVKKKNCLLILRYC